MPGWIIQGVRGEGKSLCAVGKAKEYLSRGCPVATNLDLYLDKLLPKSNDTIAYRLPDRPRASDFYALPPAFDPKYKGEDKNGLIILDELALWMNSRKWKDGGRLEIIEWLLVSRKYHWDLILLCQDHEIIDNQLKTTCCDYLVQASRTDRKKIPFIAPLLDFVGIDSFRPKVHVYDVYYGLSALDSPVDRWTYEGSDLYAGYDTNQLFTPGFEVMGKYSLDMRAIYTYLPASYLTKHFYINRLQQQIDSIKEAKLLPKFEVKPMALRKNSGSDANRLKIYFLVSVLMFSAAWAYWKIDQNKNKSSSVQVADTGYKSPVIHEQPVKSSEPVNSMPSSTVLGQKSNFVQVLLDSYKPRLAAYLENKDRGLFGIIEFYDGSHLVERLSISSIRAMGVAVIPDKHGVDIITNSKIYVVTAWPLTANDQQQIKQVEKI
ncbi:zonular occludens toxin domain-containing protein [Methylomicrobium sp. Wu6]|uniref:zonular occludens toxin domain-containing protein n=1 Tax=Methylomicrobium sp. Wu6 TaxID=3107928 RepID=UPI002DD676C3|nr:zonular occludens toxin domain-containing protein [Methylomicrobium sp. Wu6]MEC4749806.1 zonular occludens toxin domain-containing protein [Methylomicrobium sp. Wu6]